MNLSPSDRQKITQLLQREPSHVELYIFDTMWSEHCSYKSTKETLKAHLPTQGSEVALGIGEDAGIIRFAQHEGKSYCIAISHESHNHPSQILPVEGAATGVGGVVRDVYCMGADVIGVLNSLHFGIDETGKSLVDDIAKNVVIGVADYANPLGVPVLGGETLYHASYNDNCLVNVASVGLVEEDKIIRSRVPEAAKNEPYDVILIGKSTDATGFGGASFSSVTLDQDNEALNIGAVQVHDPFLKRVVVEAIKAVQAIIFEQNVQVGFKDLGAGGIACVTSEIAAASGFGVTVDLELVPTAIDHLAPEVIACSETQERFCLVVPKWFSKTVLKVFNEEYAMPQLYPNAGAAIIGTVTTDPTFTLTFKGETVCSLPIHAITTEVREVREAKAHAPVRFEPKELPKINIQQTGLALLSLPNNRSKRPIYRYFDHSVQGNIVRYTGEADAVVSAPIQGCKAGLATTIDSNLYGNANPFVSGAAAVAETVRNLVSVGARPIAITDCLNYGNPQNPEAFYDFQEGVKGIAAAANALGFIEGEALPIISGNVSLYNDSKQGAAIVPSPVIVGLGKIEDYRKSVTMAAHKPDLCLIAIGPRFPEFGGTQVDTLVNGLPNTAPEVRFEVEAAQNKAVLALIQSGLVQACHDCSAGGFWITMIEMLLGERGRAPIGASLIMPGTVDPMTFLFSENGGYILAVRPEDQAVVTKRLENLTYVLLGETNAKGSLQIHYQDKCIVDLTLKDLQSARES